MGGWDGFIKRFAAKPAADLCLADPAVCAGQVDMLRFAQERLPPAIYLTASYYQRWALATEKNVVERSLAGADELEPGHALRAGKPLKRKLTAAGLTLTNIVQLGRR